MPRRIFSCIFSQIDNKRPSGTIPLSSRSPTSVPTKASGRNLVTFFSTDPSYITSGRKKCVALSHKLTTPRFGRNLQNSREISRSISGQKSAHSPLDTIFYHSQTLFSAQFEHFYNKNEKRTCILEIEYRSFIYQIRLFK